MAESAPPRSTDVKHANPSTTSHHWPVRWLAEAGDALASVFFAAGCRICDSLLVRASRVPICEECLAAFSPVPEKQCEVCGQALEGLVELQEHGMVCPICRQRAFAFDRA